MGIIGIVNFFGNEVLNEESSIIASHTLGGFKVVYHAFRTLSWPMKMLIIDIWR